MAANFFDKFDNAQAPQPQGMVLGTPDPTKAYAVPLVQAQLAKAKQDQQLNDVQIQKERALTVKAQQEAALGAGPKLTSEDRAKAITSYTSAQQLANLAADLRSKFAAGPGQTSGIGGIKDYLPTTANQRFDKAGDAVRGLVGSALGFTGSQLNTEKEAAAAIGPYLPHANDRDEVILDKIKRIEELAKSAQGRSVSVLGGVPDESGNITPISQAKDTQLPGLSASNGAGAPPSSGGTPLGALATGATRNDVSDPTLKLVTGLIRQGLSADQINAVLKESNLGSVKPEDIANAQATLKAGGSIAATQEVPNSLLSRISASPVGAYGINAANMIMGDNLDSLTSNPEQTRAAMGMVQQANPISSTLGSISGGALAAMGSEMALGGAGARLGGGIAGKILSSPRTADAAYGAFAGAGGNDEDRLTGAVTGAGAGLLGGMFGRGLARGASKTLRGVGNVDVGSLYGQGVPLTVGQALGGTAKGIEDRLTGVPIIGDIIKNRRTEGLEGFNQAAFDQGLGKGKINSIGETGIEQARDTASNMYGQALNGVQIAPDQAGTAAYQAALARGAGVARTGPEFESYAQQRFSPMMNQPTISGPQIQDMLQGVRSANFGSDSMGQMATDATRDIGGAITDMVGRQAPDVIPALGAANNAYRNTSILADAVGRGSNTGGVFTPAQLGLAAKGNATKFGGKISASTTDRPFFELQRAGQNVLPSAVPDSGTAGRLATLALPGVLGGAGATTGYASGDTSTGAEAGAGLGALLALGGTKTGQKALTKLLIERPDLLKQLGNGVAKRVPSVGMFGAGFGSLVPSYVQ